MLYLCRDSCRARGRRQVPPLSLIPSSRNQPATFLLGRPVCRIQRIAQSPIRALDKHPVPRLALILDRRPWTRLNEVLTSVVGVASRRGSSAAASKSVRLAANRLIAVASTSGGGWGIDADCVSDLVEMGAGGHRASLRARVICESSSGEGHHDDSR